MKDAVDFLKELLAVPSVNGRDDEGRAAEFLCGFFRGAGLEARVQRIDETHANVLAVLEGEDKAGDFVWNGHLDTVPYGKTGDSLREGRFPLCKGGQRHEGRPCGYGLRPVRV